MYCKHCGNEINDSSKFCDKCGKAIEYDNFDNKNYQYIEEDYDRYLYKEPLMKSIIKGFDFMPSCFVGFAKILGEYRYLSALHIIAYMVCIFALLPIWLIVSIIIILYRILIMPSLKRNNIL